MRSVFFSARLFASGRRVSALGGLSCLLLLSSACEEQKSEAPAPPPSRYAAVTQKDTVTADQLEGFCDVKDKGPLKLPDTQGPKEPTGGRWINVWATWCKSCVEEIPMMQRWQKEHGITVHLVSADEEPGALPAFLKEHPSFPTSATMNEPDSLTEWMKSLGLDAGAGLPLHLFVSSDNQLRCARAGAVSEHHLALVKSLLK